MKTQEFKTSALSEIELRQTNGGLLFLLPFLFSAAEGAVAWGPIYGAALKGWNDYK
jgi:hypothetical protein